MANTFIKINTSAAGATQAALLKQWVANERSVYEIGTRIRAITSNNNDTGVSPADFSQIETLFGLESGKGQSVYDLINGTVGAMEGSFQNSNGKTLGELLG